MTSLVSGGMELLSSPLQSDLTRKVRKTNLSVATLRIIILFFFFFCTYSTVFAAYLPSKQLSYDDARGFELRPKRRPFFLSNNFPRLTLLVGTDNVTEKTRAIIRLVKYLVPSPLHDKRKDHGIFGWLEIRAHQIRLRQT